MQAIYTWISKGRSGISAFHRENGKEFYPKSAIVPLPLKLNQEIILDFAARGSLLNVWVNGRLAIVHRMPMARRKGAFSLWNHSATAEYFELKITELPKAVRLAESRKDNLATPFVKTALESPEKRLARQVRSHALARLRLKLAESQLAALKSRVAAEQSKYKAQHDKSTHARLATTAARAQRQTALDKAILDLHLAQQHLAVVRVGRQAERREQNRGREATRGRSQIRSRGQGHVGEDRCQLHTVLRPLSEDQHRAPVGIGAMDGRSQQPANSARGGQSHLAEALWIARLSSPSRISGSGRSPDHIHNFWTGWPLSLLRTSGG